MKKRFKSKLIPYVKEIKSDISDLHLEELIKADKNLKLLSSINLKIGHTIFWISGFGERVVFFLKRSESKKRPFYHLVCSLIELEGEEK